MQCIIIEKQSDQIHTLWLNKEKGPWLTDSQTMMGIAKDKHLALTHGLKFYVRAVIESEAWPTVVQLKRNP